MVIIFLTISLGSCFDCRRDEAKASKILWDDEFGKCTRVHGVATRVGVKVWLLGLRSYR